MRSRAIVAVAAIAVTVVLSSDAFRSPVSPLPLEASASCLTTPRTEWQPRRSALPAAWRATQDLPSWSMVVSGRLATSHSLRNIVAGTEWFIADEPRAFIRLRAERLDAPSIPIEFDAIGHAHANLLPDRWDRGWYYRTTVAVGFDDRFPLRAGCWRIVWVDGTEADFVTFLSKGPAFNSEVGWRGAPR